MNKQCNYWLELLIVVGGVGCVGGVGGDFSHTDVHLLNSWYYDGVS